LAETSPSRRPRPSGSSEDAPSPCLPVGRLSLPRKGERGAPRMSAPLDLPRWADSRSSPAISVVAAFLVARPRRARNRREPAPGPTRILVARQPRLRRRARLHPVLRHELHLHGPCRRRAFTPACSTSARGAGRGGWRRLALVALHLASAGRARAARHSGAAAFGAPGLHRRLPASDAGQPRRHHHHHVQTGSPASSSSTFRSRSCASPPP
jgi:hypothetical protein